MNWIRLPKVPDVDWRRGLDWLRVGLGPLVAAGAVVFLWTMSTAPTALARVPDFTGLRADVADAFAGEHGLRTKGVRIVHGGIAGTVVGQVPKAGTFLRRGEVVNVEITLGARQIVVPQVASMPVDQARDVLTRAGFTVAGVVYEDYPNREPGRVVATSPPPGTRVDQGTGVEVFVPLPPHT